MNLDQNVDKQVTIESVAENASAGAIVSVGRTPVYIEGLPRWDRALDGKKVAVTGTLRREAADDVVGKNGERSHGIPSGRFVIEAASWKLA